MFKIDKRLIATTDNGNTNDGILFDEIVTQFTVAEADITQGLAKVDVDKLRSTSQRKLLALDPNNTVEMMLIAQMLSVHKLQQELMPFANKSKHLQGGHGHINSIIKLSNLFVNQITLLNRLKHDPKEKAPQSVHVHEGAQAVVGTVHCYSGLQDKENGK